MRHPLSLRSQLAALIWSGTPLAAGAPLAAAAQEPLLEPEMVVTGTRTASPLEVITDPVKPRQPVPAHDGADYLKTVPGFSIIRKGGTDGDPVFRGMAGSRVSIVTNEDLLLGGCGARMDPPTAYVFPQSYDRIRVLKGPQSVLFGAGASAATVLFEREPYERGAGASEVDASVTLASSARRDAAIDSLLGNELGFVRVQASDARADDYEDGSGNEVHGRYHRWNALVGAGWTPSDDTSVELDAARSGGEAAYADRTMDGVRFDRESLTLRVARRNVSERVSRVEGQVARGYIDHVMDNYSLRAFVPSMAMPNPAASNPDRETLAARFSASLTLGPALTADVGFDAHDDEHRVRASMNERMRSYAGLPRVADATFTQRGVFAEMSFEPTPGRLFESGLRVDRWHVADLRGTVRQGMTAVPNATAGATDRENLTSGFARYEHTLGPAAAAHDIALFAGLGYAERTADYWERFGNDKQSVGSNSAFYTDPERTAQLDLGILHESARGRWSASLFTSRIADYILIDTLATGKPLGTVVTRNVDAATAGGEIELVRNLSERLTLDSSLAYTRGTNRSDGVPLAQIPPLEARAALAYTGPRYSIGGLIRWVADQDRIDRGRGNIAGQDVAAADSFTVLSLNGSYRVSTKINLSMGVDNLLDETYSEHLSRAGAMVAGYVQSQRIAEPGRTLWLKVDVTP